MTMPELITLPRIIRSPLSIVNSGGRAYAGLATPQREPENPYRFEVSWTAVAHYTIDWSVWLPTGDTIATSNWVADTGLTVSEPSFTDTTVTIRVGPGGIPYYAYKVANTVTSAGGLTGVRRLWFKMLPVVGQPSVAACLGGGGDFGTPRRPYYSDVDR